MRLLSFSLHILCLTVQAEYSSLITVALHHSLDTTGRRCCCSGPWKAPDCHRHYPLTDPLPAITFAQALSWHDAALFPILCLPILPHGGPLFPLPLPGKDPY